MKKGLDIEMRNYQIRRIETDGVVENCEKESSALNFSWSGISYSIKQTVFTSGTGASRSNADLSCGEEIDFSFVVASVAACLQQFVFSD